MSMTLSRCSDRFVVHELLTPEDAVTNCTPDSLHFNEAPGRDIICSEDGLWREVLRESSAFGDIVVDAGPIMHRGIYK
jgi:ribonuclease Z